MRRSPPGAAARSRKPPSRHQTAAPAPPATASPSSSRDPVKQDPRQPSRPASHRNSGTQHHRPHHQNQEPGHDATSILPEPASRETQEPRQHPHRTRTRKTQESRHQRPPRAPIPHPASSGHSRAQLLAHALEPGITRSRTQRHRPRPEPLRPRTMRHNPGSQMNHRPLSRCQAEDDSPISLGIHAPARNGSHHAACAPTVPRVQRTSLRSPG